MHKLKFATFAIILTFSVLVFQSSIVSAQFNEATNEACKGLAVDDAAFISCNTDSGGSRINSILEVGLNLLSFLAGVIAVVMIIISGIKFITSEGDASKVASARSSILYAIIGIIIVVIAQTLVIFVIGRSTKVVTTPQQTNQNGNTDQLNGAQ